MSNPFVIVTDVEPAVLEPARHIFAELGAPSFHYNCRTEEQLTAPQPHALLIFLGATQVSRRVLEALTHCQIVARCGIGVDSVDLPAAEERGIRVTNVPDYCIDEVSAHTLALMLSLARKLRQSDLQIRGGVFGTTAIDLRPIKRFAGSTVGIIGFSRIGQSVARKLKGFDVRLLVSDPYVPAEKIVQAGCVPVDLSTLLRESDYVTLHCPHSPQTHHMIGREQLSLMKPSAYLINTARGKLIDQAALVEALSQKTIAGAGLDVFEQEPPAADDPLLSLDNVILSPHTAWYSEEAFAENVCKGAQEIVRAVRGEPALNPVRSPQ